MMFLVRQFGKFLNFVHPLCSRYIYIGTLTRTCMYCTHCLLEIFTLLLHMQLLVKFYQYDVIVTFLT